MFSIGADPEFFLTEAGTVVSAEGKIGGTKEEPKLFDDRGFFMQEDNVMVEFNIPVSFSKQEFIDNIEFAKEYLTKHAELIGCGVKYSASETFTDLQLSTEQAKYFGCEPDKNVYTKSKNVPVCNMGNIRCAGGHVHVGYEFIAEEEKELFIKALDVYLGLDSVLLDRDTRRREFYGKAGSYRDTGYGIEYRVLSNFWLNSKDYIQWVYDGVAKAINNMYIIDFDTHQQQIIEAINEGSIEKAIKVKETIITELETV